MKNIPGRSHTNHAESRRFEHLKWEAQEQRAERELRLREAQASLAEKEFLARESEVKRARWFNPLALAVLAAAMAGAANAFVAWLNGENQIRLELTRNSELRSLEEAKAEHARVLEAIKLTDPNQVKRTLNLLMETGLISDKVKQERISSYLINLASSHADAATAKPSVASTDVDCMRPCQPEPDRSAPPAQSVTASSPGGKPATAPTQPASSGQTAPPLGIEPPTKPTSRPDPMQVEYRTSWMSGGFDQRRACDQGMSIQVTQHPGRRITVLRSSEDSRRDFLGRVEYRYSCTFLIE